MNPLICDEKGNGNIVLIDYKKPIWYPYSLGLGSFFSRQSLERKCFGMITNSFFIYFFLHKLHFSQNFFSLFSYTRGYPLMMSEFKGGGVQEIQTLVDKA